MEIHTTDTIRAIDEEEWNTLVGNDSVERSHGWYRTVEDSRMRHMQYVFIKEGKELKAAACCFLFNEKMYMEMPFLEVRSPLGTSLGFFSKSPEEADILIKELQNIQKREKAKGILILDLIKEEYDSLGSQVKGFTGFRISENTYIDLDFNDFSDYLKTLSRKKRKGIRNTLNKARKRWKIKTVFTNEFLKWKSEAHRLQGFTCEQHNDYRWHLTDRFYQALEKNLKTNAELLFFLKDDIPIVFALSLNSPTTSLCKFVGVDPEYREYQAYFLMYYETIKRAIERNQKRIYFGPSTYTLKEKIGCKREELFGLVNMRNPVLHLALKSYIAVLKASRKKF